MILLKSLEDCDKITSAEQRKAAVYITSMLLEQIEGEPVTMEESGYTILIDNRTDNIEIGMPHLNDSERGLLCYGTLGTTEEAHVGWAWEAVAYFLNERVYHIVIICNNEFGVGYLVPDDEFMHPELRAALEKIMVEGNMDMIVTDI